MGADRSLRRRSAPALRRAMIVIALSISCAAAVEAILIAQDQPDYAVPLVAYVIVGLSFVLVGLLAWDRRPSNRTGFLITVAGLLTLASSFGNMTSAPIMIVGQVVAQAPIAALLHVLMSYPSGRLRDRIDRALVIAGYVLTVGFQVPRVIWSDRPSIATGFQDLQALTGAITIVIAAVIMIRRLRALAPSGQRRSLAVVYGYGIGTMVFFPFSARVLAPLLHLDEIQLFVLQISVLFGVPFVTAAGILLGVFARTTEIDELASWLGRSDAARPPLSAALADALGDDTLRLGFRVAAGSTVWVDAQGHPIETNAGDHRRASVEVEGPNGTAALIDYDPTLIADPALVQAAGRVVALALERERLTMEVIASREAVRESRSRLVEVADAERRRMAQDLHDLLQSRLVLAALEAGALAENPSSNSDTRVVARALRSDLDAAITELRGLVHGVMPALLVERGLYVAAEELIDRQPIPVDLDLHADDRPLPPAVATTCYFILAEALSNVVKHAQADEARVRLVRAEDRLVLTIADQGSGGAHLSGHGLRGLADRADALNGSFDLSSPVGVGTMITVELPCAV